jgi:hypothetical protein
MRKVLDIPEFSEMLGGGLSYSFDRRLKFVNAEYSKITSMSFAVIVRVRVYLSLSVFPMLSSQLRCAWRGAMLCFAL